MGTSFSSNLRTNGKLTNPAVREIEARSIFACSINADDCFSLYAKSGAVRSSKTCKLDVTSNTSGGMDTYACINDLALIDQWCNSTGTPSDDSCPVADHVFPANGIVVLSRTNFSSGDTSPLVSSRSYLSEPFDKSQTAMGGYWVTN